MNNGKSDPADVGPFKSLTEKLGDRVIDLVDVEETSESSGSESMPDGEWPFDIPKALDADADASRRELLDWSAKHEMLYGKQHGAAAVADAWGNHVVFDTSYRCIAMRVEHGVCIAEDITQGILMANVSGHNAAEERLTVLAFCAECGVEIVHAGDRSILRPRAKKQGMLHDGLLEGGRRGMLEDEVQTVVGACLGQEHYVVETNRGLCALQTGEGQVQQKHPRQHRDAAQGIREGPRRCVAGKVQQAPQQVGKGQPISQGAHGPVPDAGLRADDHREHSHALRVPPGKLREDSEGRNGLAPREAAMRHETTMV